MVLRCLSAKRNGDLKKPWTLPANVIHTASFVAERLGVEDEELATLTTRNARNLFGLPLEV